MRFSCDDVVSFFLVLGVMKGGYGGNIFRHNGPKVFGDKGKSRLSLLFSLVLL